MEYSYQP
jgi:hypothetical protein